MAQCAGSPGAAAAEVYAPLYVKERNLRVAPKATDSHSNTRRRAPSTSTHLNRVRFRLYSICVFPYIRNNAYTGASPCSAKKSVLFVSTANAACAQMAEARFAVCNRTQNTQRDPAADSNVSARNGEESIGIMSNTLTPTDVFKCLGDDTRARIALLIEREQELCVCELTCAIDENQPKISRHLALLRNCGLLADRRQGQWVYYRLHPQLPDWVREVIKVTGDANQKWLDIQIGRLNRMGDRPARAAACC